MKSHRHWKNMRLRFIFAAILVIGVFIAVLYINGRLRKTHETVPVTYLYTSPRLGFSVAIPQIVAAYNAGCGVTTGHLHGHESAISYRPVPALVPLVALESSTTGSLVIAPSYYYSLGGETDVAVDGTLSSDNAQPTFGEFSTCKRIATTLDNIHDQNLFIQLTEQRVTSDADLERLATDNLLCDVDQKLPDTQAGVYDVTLKCDQLHADPTDADYRIKYYPARQVAVFFPLTGPRGCQLFRSVADLENPDEYPACYDGTIIKTLKFNSP